MAAGLAPPASWPHAIHRGAPTDLFICLLFLFMGLPGYPDYAASANGEFPRALFIRVGGKRAIFTGEKWKYIEMFVTCQRHIRSSLRKLEGWFSEGPMCAEP